MSIKFQFTIEDDILIVRNDTHDGATKDELIEYIMAVIQEGLRLNSPAMLVDVTRLSYRLTLSDEIAASEAVASAAKGLRKIALVYAKQFVADNIIFETIAVNRGLNVKVFTSEEEARKWLGAPAQR